MMNKLFAVGLMASTVLAAGNTSPFLKARQLVEVPCTETGMKDCGDGCIETDWTCCPIGEGGCRPGTYCTETGCCPNGETCVGDGGTTTYHETFTYTNTNTASISVPTYSYPPESSTTPVSSTPTPSSSASPTYSYPTQSAAPTFTGAADRNVGSGVASFAGVVAGLFML